MYIVLCILYNVYCSILDVNYGRSNTISQDATDPGLRLVEAPPATLHNKLYYVYIVYFILYIATDPG